jgi:hypothetical protein
LVLVGVTALLDCVSFDQVAAAALRAVGLPITDGFATIETVPGLYRLTPAQRAAIERIVT